MNEQEQAQVIPEVEPAVNDKPTPRTPPEVRDHHVINFKNSGLSRKVYAARNDISEKNLQNWLYREKAVAGKVKPKPKTDLMHDPVSQKDQQISSLTYQRDELIQKLEDANLKIKSLMNVLVLCGHQIGDE
jgi:hypothetical protein